MNGNKVIEYARKFLGQGSATFADWYYGSSSYRGWAWCAVFVSYVLSHLGIKWEKNNNVANAQIWCSKNLKWVNLSEAQAGDIVIFCWSGEGNNSGRGSRDHIGFLISRNANGTFTTLEGNTSGSRVALRIRYPKNIRNIYRPDYSTSPTVGWIQDSKGWWYKTKEGNYYKSTWAQLDGAWYYFDSSGYAVTGWQQIKDKWYYFDSSCKMHTGWLSIGGKWYYLDPNDGSAYISGMHAISDKNYYFNSDGAMQVGWVKTDNEWQFYNDNGSRVEKGLVMGDNAVFAVKDGTLITDGTVDIKADKDGAISVV
nr:MAG TPA: hypothetical protein [Caudoviricetes sp.]